VWWEGISCGPTTYCTALSLAIMMHVLPQLIMVHCSVVGQATWGLAPGPPVATTQPALPTYTAAPNQLPWSPVGVSGVQKGLQPVVGLPLYCRQDSASTFSGRASRSSASLKNQPLEQLRPRFGLHACGMHVGGRRCARAEHHAASCGQAGCQW
jgi:hypothetical protein